MVTSEEGGGGMLEQGVCISLVGKPPKIVSHSLYYVLHMCYKNISETTVLTVLVNDMQTLHPHPPLPSKRAVLIVWSKKMRNVLKRMKNQFSNLYGRSILTVWLKKKNVNKRYFCSWNLFVTIFSNWDTVDILLNIHIELGTWEIFTNLIRKS